MNTVAALSSLEDLRKHVLQTLCTHDNLDPKVTPLLEGAMTRSGRVCGLFFQAQGPRHLRTYALWASEEHRILFYDSTGMRFGETKLSDAPDTPKMRTRRAA
jgi:hypothetical protein